MHARKFTRYPTDTSVTFVIDSIMGEHQLYLKDAGQGGLCFNARGCIKPGTHLDIKIPLNDKGFDTVGKITWCQPLETGQCQVGIEFDESLTLSIIEKMALRH